MESGSPEANIKKKEKKMADGEEAGTAMIHKEIGPAQIVILTKGALRTLIWATTPATSGAEGARCTKANATIKS